MSEESLTPEERFDALEKRFAQIERRYAVQEERMSRILSLIVRIAERQGLRERPKDWV